MANAGGDSEDCHLNHEYLDFKTSWEKGLLPLYTVTCILLKSCNRLRDFLLKARAAVQAPVSKDRLASKKKMAKDREHAPVQNQLTIGKPKLPDIPQRPSVNKDFKLFRDAYDELLKLVLKEKWGGSSTGPGKQIIEDAQQLRDGGWGQTRSSPA